MKIEINCPQGRPRGTRVYADEQEITHIRSLKLEIIANDLPRLEIVKTVPDPSDPDEATGKILLDPNTKEPALEVLHLEAEELHFIGERFYRSHFSERRVINLTPGIKMFAENIDSGEVIELTDYLYFFEEQGIRKIGGEGLHGEKYRLWIELPDDD